MNKNKIGDVERIRRAETNKDRIFASKNTLSAPSRHSTQTSEHSTLLVVSRVLQL